MQARKLRKTLASLLDIYARHGDATAFAERRGLRTARRSYRWVVETARQIARELEARGIKRGDRVVLWAANSAEWAAAFWGCCLRGATVVPLDVGSTDDLAARVIAQTQAKLLLHDGVQRAEERAVPLAALLQQAARQPTDPLSLDQSDADDLAEIIYTSGTTAEPRGVCLTHRNLLANIAPIESETRKYLKWERLVHPIRFLDLVPLSHVFGQFMGLFIPPLIGGEVHFQHSLNPAEVIATTKRERISVIVAVPRLLDSLREQIEREWAARATFNEKQRLLDRAAHMSVIGRWLAFRDVHKLFGWKFWAFIVGGATLRPETESFWRRLGFAVIQGYGMTETAALIALNHPFRARSGAVGRALPASEIKLAENGEILVRGEAVARGYWTGRLEPVADDQGWLHTGDLGELDAEGNIIFKGRRKDVIVTAAGMNIYPEDLEAALRRQPEVRDACVVRLEEDGREEPLAVLLLAGAADDPTSAAARAVERANELLAPHQRIRRWTIWPEPDFPRTPTQKIKRREVLARLRTPAPAARDLSELVAQLAGAPQSRAVPPQAKLATDLGLDSFGRIELLSMIEDRFQVSLDEQMITDETTVADLERMIQRDRNTAAAPRYPYADWPRRFPFTWLRALFFYALVWPLVRLMARPQITGRQRLRELSAPALFIANHVTMIDQALILVALPPRFRHRLAIAMDGELLRAWRWPDCSLPLLARWRLRAQYALVVALFNVFPLPQRSGFRRSFSVAGELVDRGWSLLVFPEGRRTETGKMGPFRQGVGLLATQLGLPVVPIKLEGLFELKEQRRRTAPPGQIRVLIGEPLRFAADRDPAEATRELEASVAHLTPAARRA